MPDTPASQPDFFVGWWEIVFHIRDGEQTDVTGIIEHVDAAGNFTVFRDAERIGSGHHVDFTVDPDGFTNVPVAADPDLQIARELATYRFSGDVLEVCRAGEHAVDQRASNRLAGAGGPTLRSAESVTTTHVSAPSAEDRSGDRYRQPYRPCQAARDPPVLRSTICA